jgi:hypothetical protein
MSKKLTPAIAKALAENVRAELIARHKGSSETLLKKVESSKLYKELLLTMTKIEELEEKKTSLRKEIGENFSTKMSDVAVSPYCSSNSKPHVSVNYRSAFSVDSIKDMVLIEDYMSDQTKTPEEFIKYIADKLSK